MHKFISREVARYKRSNMNSIAIGDELESTLYVVWACTFGISSHPMGTLFAALFTKAVGPLRAVAGSALFTLDFSSGDHAKNMQTFRTDVRAARKRYGGHHDCCTGDEAMQQWRRSNVVVPRSCEIFALRKFRRETTRPRDNFVEIRRKNKSTILSADLISTLPRFGCNETPSRDKRLGTPLWRKIYDHDLSTRLSVRGDRESQSWRIVLTEYAAHERSSYYRDPVRSLRFVNGRETDQRRIALLHGAICPPCFFIIRSTETILRYLYVRRFIENNR